MKRMVGLALLLLMLAASVCSGAVAETVTALESNYLDVEFTENYRGFCLDRELTGAYKNDIFNVAENTSAARDNTPEQNDISQKLKLLFAHCFDELFVSDGNDGYMIPANIADGPLGNVVYHFVGEQNYVSGLEKTLVNKVNAYDGPEIPDEGYTKTLDNGDIVKFSFKVFEPRKEGQQTFFAYRINTASVVDSENGTVTIERNSGSTEGVEIKVTVEPENGYELDKLIVGGEDVSGSVQDNEYAFMLLDEDVTVQATFKKTEEAPVIYTVTVTTDGNGTATANMTEGTTGTDVTLSATPNPGYQFKEWQVVSGNVTVDENNTFVIDNEDVEIKAVFEKVYQVSVTKEGNGQAMITPSSAPEGKEMRLIVEPAAGFRLVSLTINGENVTDEVKNNMYSFTMPAENVELKAVFEAIPETEYTVTVNESENGSVESDKTRAAEDETVTLTVKPDAGYELNTLVVDGQDVTSSVENDQYAFSMPAEDVTVQATFKKTEEAPVIYTVTVNTDGNGTATANPTEGTTGTQVTLSATPNTGYQFKEWQVVSGGVTIANNEFAIGNENVEVKAIFEAIPEAPVTYTVTFDANGGSGTMEIQTFQQGVEQALTMNAFTYEGHVFDGWNIMPDGSGDALADGETLQLAGNITLYAQWKAETVVNPLRIVKHPQDQYVTAGQQAEFSVEAEGDGVTYQWYIDRMDGNGLCVIDGANDQNYVTSTVNPDNDEYLYLCRVTDAHGNTMLSGAAVLHVSALSAMPATGDASAPLLWLAMGMLSMLGMALLGRKAKAE